jgi:TonB family protein
MRQTSMGRGRIDPFTIGIAASILLHVLVFLALFLQRAGGPVRLGDDGTQEHWIYLQLAALPTAGPGIGANAPALNPPPRPRSLAVHRRPDAAKPRRRMAPRPSLLARVITSPVPRAVAEFAAALSPPASPAKAVQVAATISEPALSKGNSSPMAAASTGTAAQRLAALASPVAAAGGIGGLPLFYRREVSTLIDYRLRPPPAVTGTVVVRMHLRRDGIVLGAMVIRGSGTPALDQEAREVVLRIHRFDWLPDDAIPGVADFSIDEPIRFHG